MKHLPKLRPYLKCRTWWEEPPTGPDKRSNSLKMSLSQPPTFWTGIPMASAYSKSPPHNLTKLFCVCYTPLIVVNYQAVSLRPNQIKESHKIKRNNDK